MKRFIALWILLSAGLNIWQSIHIKKLEAKRPIVVYKADNYGVFVVTKTNYESLKIGDEVRL